MTVKTISLRIAPPGCQCVQTGFYAESITMSDRDAQTAPAEKSGIFPGKPGRPVNITPHRNQTAVFRRR
jgi:hypothetical protein